MNTNNSSHGFFNWIRSAQIRRSDSRWIGGVCAGIADRLGWDKAIVRVIMVLLLITGAGFAAYTIAWLLLPDSHGEILFERIIHGIWSGEGVVAFVLCIIAIISTAATFWGGITVAALFVLIAYSSDQAKKPQNWQMSDAGYMSKGYGENTAAATSDGQNASNAAHTSSANASNNMAGQPSQNSAYSQPSYPHPLYSQPVYPQVVERERVIVKRKGAGPVVHLLILGAILLSIAGVYFAGRYWLGIGSQDAVSWLRLGTLWYMGIVAFLFLVTLCLALAGRRSAGYGVLAGILALGVIIMGGASLGMTSVNSYIVDKDFKIVRTQVVQHNGITLRASKQLIKELESGVAFKSDSAFHTRKLTLDLTNWKDVQGMHEWTSPTGEKRESSCPTGKFFIALDGVDLHVKIPQGCTYTNTYRGVLQTGSESNVDGHYNTVAGIGQYGNPWSELSKTFKDRVANKLQDYLSTHEDIDEDDSATLRYAINDARDSTTSFEDWLDKWADEDAVSEALSSDTEGSYADNSYVDDYYEEVSRRMDENAELHVTTNSVAAMMSFEEVKNE